ncbi:MAG: hypothetical protein WBQ95_21915 [Terracidiphilus sp.]
MRTILSRYILSSAVIALAALATTSAKAETTLNVPFSFTFAGKTCPAGHYSVRHDLTSNFVILRNEDSSQTYTWILTTGAPESSRYKIAMQFDSIGETHALRSIQMGSMITPQLDNASAERATARHPEGQ